MIAAIHFEGNLCIKCSYEKNQIIEHAPIYMEETWDFYVKAELQKMAQKDSMFLGVLLEQASQEQVLAMESMRKMYHLTKKQLRFFTKEEAFLGWMKYEETWLEKGNAGLFDYGMDGLFYYYIQKMGEKLSVHKVDVTKYMELSKSEKDIPFLSAIKDVLAKGVTSVVYLHGQGFQGNWMKESAKLLCSGRRVFMGDHIFAQGMIGANLVERKQGDIYDSVILTQNGTKHNIYVQLKDEKKVESALLLKEKMAWTKSKNELIVVGKDCSRIRICVEYPQKDEKRIHELKISGNKAVKKYRIEAEYIGKSRCKIKVYDLGFGKLVPSSHRVYQTILLLSEEEDTDE